MSDLPLGKIVCADVLDYLRSLPDNVVNCIVTSPPYWGLRNYQVAGQIGLESTLTEYIDKLTVVFHEARRVLRPDGVAWINMGDSYASSPNGRSAAATKELGTDDRTFRDKPISTVGDGLKPKDLCGQPWRLAFSLQADGWWLRADVIWHKPNPMPASVRDRPTVAHEYVFLMTKSATYWYDAEAIREPAQNWGSRDRSDGKYTAGNVPISGGAHHGLIDGNFEQHGRNKRTVWTVATHSFAGAHFATFPPKLIEPMILAGCPPEGIVLDPFMGAGTTALVAIQLGRRWLGCELNESYVALANERLSKQTIPMFPKGE